MLYNEWEKLICEFKKSSKTQAQWCKEKNLSVKAFNFQYRKYRALNGEYNKKEEIKFIPIKIEPTEKPLIKIQIGKVKMEIEAGYDVTLLKSVVKVLGELC
jgi:hypothetical protein